MVKKPVIFLGRTYESQKEFKTFVEDVIYNRIGICGDVKRIYPSEYDLLIKILERHPTFTDKSRDMCNIKIISMYKIITI